MLERPELTPTLNAGELVNQDIVRLHLRQWVSDTAATRTALAALRDQANASSRQLENPKAVLEYLDFFDGFFDRVTQEVGRIDEELATAFVEPHAETLVRLANNAAAELRRTVVFRDRWVNKPLPYETVRPMLTQMANDVRAQLTDYREMPIAAAVLRELSAAPAPPESRPEGLGRRELFTRLVRPPGGGTDT